MDKLTVGLKKRLYPFLGGIYLSVWYCPAQSARTVHP